MHFMAILQHQPYLCLLASCNSIKCQVTYLLWKVSDAEGNRELLGSIHLRQSEASLRDFKRSRIKAGRRISQDVCDAFSHRVMGNSGDEIGKLHLLTCSTPEAER